MSTLGNSKDFGDLTVARYYGSSTSSSTRGIFWNGWTPTRINTIDYVQIMTIGNAVDLVMPPLKQMLSLLHYQMVTEV